MYAVFKVTSLGFLAYLFLPYHYCMQSFFHWTELFIFLYFTQILLLNGHKGMMFLTGLTRMLMIVKVLWMAKDGHHTPILLLLIYMNRSPCTEHLHILSSKGSCNTTTSNIALVNQFLTGLISIFMILKLLRMAKDGHHSHIPPLLSYKNQSPCTEHLHILKSSRSFLVSPANQFWYQSLLLLLILLLVADHSRLLQVIVQAT